MVVGVQAYSRAGGDCQAERSTGGRLLTRSSKFSSDHLRERLYVLVSVVVGLMVVAVVVLLLLVVRFESKVEVVVCQLGVLLSVCGVWKRLSVE